jgi:hypothetical protein
MMKYGTIPGTFKDRLVEAMIKIKKMKKKGQLTNEADSPSHGFSLSRKENPRTGTGPN